MSDQRATACYVRGAPARYCSSCCSAWLGMTCGVISAWRLPDVEISQAPCLIRHVVGVRCLNSRSGMINGEGDVRKAYSDRASGAASHSSSLTTRRPTSQSVESSTTGTRRGISLKKRRDGRCSATLVLLAGQRYRFRYLADSERWENDYAADGHIRNEFGDDSVVVL